MHGDNTHMVNQRDLEFKDILANAVYTIQSRLREYNDKKDPLERNRLKLLYDLVSIEMEKVDSGMADSYSGLRGPLKAAMDWGEPGDSSLIRALQEVELFYRQNYQIDGARTMRMPRRQPISPMIHT